MRLLFRERELAFSFRDRFLLFTTVLMLLFGFFAPILEMKLFLFLLVFEFVPAGFAELCALFVDGFFVGMKGFGGLRLF